MGDFNVTLHPFYIPNFNSMSTAASHNTFTWQYASHFPI